MPGVVGADFWAMYDVRGVCAPVFLSSGVGGADASRGNFELRGARDRLWRLGYERRDRDADEDRDASIVVSFRAYSR